MRRSDSVDLDSVAGLGPFKHRRYLALTSGDLRYAKKEGGASRVFALAAIRGAVAVRPPWNKPPTKAGGYILRVLFTHAEDLILLCTDLRERDAWVDSITNAATNWGSPERDEVNDNFDRCVRAVVGGGGAELCVAGMLDRLRAPHVYRFLGPPFAWLLSPGAPSRQR